MSAPELAATLQAALAAHRAGDLAAASAGYDAVLAAQPENFDALYLRGMIHLVQGALDLGETLTRRALAVKPDFPEALGNLGRIAVARGRRDAAIDAWQRALRLKPEDDALRLELGRALYEARRFADAVANQTVAVLKHPDDAEALLVLGNALFGQGQIEAALAAYRRGAAVQPVHADLQHNLGLALFERQETEAAIAQYRLALSLRPGDHTILNNLGVALRGTGDLPAAIATYQQALAVAPEDAMAWNNLGVAYTESRAIDEGIAAYRRASALDPAAADPHYNLALSLLLRGDYAEGWRELAWRWQTKSFQKQKVTLAAPEWQGEKLGDGVLLLHDEQGLGDTLQMCRYVPLAAQRARVILQVQRPLVGLLGGLAGVERVIARGEAVPDCAAHAPLMSLPGVFGTTLDTIPAADGYLQADPARVAQWRARLDALQGLRVGVVWAGNPRLGGLSYDRADRRRSLPVAMLAPLALPGVSLVSLQKGEAGRQARVVAMTDWTAGLHDMADTAALVCALDLVISVDTAVAHLAGALGRPVWFLNRFDNDWRWLLGRDDSPWYRTLRQFRQSAPGEWAEVIARVAAALSDQVGAIPGR